MLIKKDVKQFIKSDCRVAIGSEGIIGDRLLIITQGSSDAPLAKEAKNLNQLNLLKQMPSWQACKYSSNAEIISYQLAEL